MRARRGHPSSTNAPCVPGPLAQSRVAVRADPDLVERFVRHHRRFPIFIVPADGADARSGGPIMLSHSRRMLLAAVCAAGLTAACGAGLAGNQANPGGVQSAKQSGSGAKPGESAGTGGASTGGAPATVQAAGKAGAPIPTPGQTGPASGKPLGSPSPSPSPAGR